MDGKEGRETRTEGRERGAGTDGKKMGVERSVRRPMEKGTAGERGGAKEGRKEKVKRERRR